MNTKAKHIIAKQGYTPIMQCPHKHGEACWHPQATVRICCYNHFAPLTRCDLMKEVTPV